MIGSSLKLNVVSSLLWKLCERGGVSLVQFILQILLARILLPEDYAVIVLTLVFINIANIFIQTGFNTALIQKKDITDSDYSSVFYVSLGIALFLYLILYILSPVLAEIYVQPLLTPVLRFIGLTLFFGAIISIQNAVIARNFQFKKSFIANMISSLLSGGIGVYLALNDYGVWALAAQQFLSTLFLLIILFVVVKWHPRLLFSIKRVKILFSFGWKLLMSRIIDNIYISTSSLVVGKLYSPDVLSYFNKSQQFPSIIFTNIETSIQSVMLPAYSQYQDEKTTIRSIMSRHLSISSFLVFPMMFGLAAVAESLVSILLTDKWLPLVPFLQIFCLLYAIRPIQTANIQAITAMGRSDMVLRIQIIKAIFGICMILVTMFIGVYAVAVALLITEFIATIINSRAIKILIDYNYIEQWKVMIASLLLSVIMGLFVWGLQFIVDFSPLPMLVFQIICGILLYLTMTRFINPSPYLYILETIKNLK